MDRDALSDFLRRRREALAPHLVGLPSGTRRRTRGLRREEVAGLAHMSPDFYTRLEQRRGPRPSEQTVASLAEALLLTNDEREHLFSLAGHVAPPRAFRTESASPELVRVLDRLDAPAIIISDLGVTLAQNPLARALLGDQMCYDGINRSICYRWFMHPDARRIHPPEDHVLHSRAHVGILRVAHGRAAKDPYVTEIIDRLLRESREFAELWERHEVGRGNLTRKRFVHPEIGTVTLDCQTLTAENQLERLLVFTAREGSEDERRLAALGRVL